MFANASFTSRQENITKYLPCPEHSGVHLFEPWLSQGPKLRPVVHGSRSVRLFTEESVRRRGAVATLSVRKASAYKKGFCQATLGRPYFLSNHGENFRDRCWFQCHAHGGG